MRILEFGSTEEMGSMAKSLVMDELDQNPSLLLCAATGNSPLPLYKQLVKVAAQNPILFGQLRLIPLDEWIGLTSTEGSCDAFLQKHLIGPLGINKKNYLRFNPKSGNLNQECARIQEMLQTEGPIDICILGLGQNGHLGFNEPAENLQPHCHINNLTPQSQQHAMVENLDIKPTKGLTLGMQDILSSKHIILIVSGEGKEQAKQAFFSGKVDAACPASYLWEHSNVDCLIVH
ncbi:galactosamine-6-phosphate isomerase [Flagellimonas myxillae]|uniref:galactosamine-6-phosphate isomerase n=1 Tax=Flagellimonas myxillae TaxID=2942214 RepID=UPI00201EC54B|nr:galactosamine-6-phosphate isomerase [Muricauda myxillae]MCL6265980.1 galactosamine-6-phosphate isomerase [Muricauda myxillae]